MLERKEKRRGGRESAEMFCVSHSRAYITPPVSVSCYHNWHDGKYGTGELMFESSDQLRFFFPLSRE